MKKIMIVMLVLTMIFCLSACSNTNEMKEPVGTASDETAETEGNDKPESAPIEESTDMESPESEPAEDKIISEKSSLAEGKTNVLIAYFTVPEDVEPDGADAIAGASIVIEEGEVMGNTEYIAGIIQETIGGDLFEIKTEQEYPRDHEPLVEQADEEQSKNSRPVLSTQIENLDQYDTIILGYPNWWGDMPMPLYTFLEAYDMSGKTIIPFCPHGGSGFSDTVNSITELQPNSNIKSDGFLVSRNDVVDSKEDIITWVNGLGI